jgi:hypothetical protein
MADSIFFFIVPWTILSDQKNFKFFGCILAQNRPFLLLPWQKLKNQKKICEPEFCELFGCEAIFFGSQKLGSHKFGSQVIWIFFMVQIFPQFTNFR